jgi:hypothetical protein
MLQQPYALGGVPLVEFFTVLESEAVESLGNIEALRKDVFESNHGFMDATVLISPQSLTVPFSRLEALVATQHRRRNGNTVASHGGKHLSASSE